MNTTENTEQYHVVWSEHTGQIKDGTRTVATVSFEYEWETFNQAIESGFSEADAVKEMSR
jgi:hypothetical protein